MDIYEESAQLHEQLKGKLEVMGKIKADTKRQLSLAYTPGVAEPCRRIAKNPEDVYKYTIKGNTVAVVSDGSAVLGLGNIGARAAMPVMEGKALLFKEFAGIDAFPICIESQDADEIIATVRNIAPSFGGINLEDIAAPKCFRIEDELQDLGIPVMHDDQHGTAIVVSAALQNGLKVVGKDISGITIAVSGAGAAGTAIARILLEQGAGDVIVIDSKGVLSRDRTDLNEPKLALAKATNKHNVSGSLADALAGADVFIGLSKPGVLNKEMVSTMSGNAIVFAMANPTPEILPEEALAGGAKIVGTGRSDYPNQVNNVLAFPGVFRGALDSRATRITMKMKLAAARALAAVVAEPAADRVLPDAFDKNAVTAVANAVAQAK